MNEWPIVTLKDVFGIARGGSPRPIDCFITDDPNGINWIMIADASDSSKYITKTKKRIKQSGVSRSRLVNPGDFLLTNSMSFGRPYIMKISGCIHDGWLVLSPQHENVDQDYFYHLLRSDVVYAEFKRRAAGATVKNLNIDLVKDIKIPLPPLPEQKRIAAILDKAEELRGLRRRALEQLDAMVQSIFLEMFGDPVANPKGYSLMPMGSLFSSSPIFGTMIPPVAEPLTWLSLRVANIQNWKLDLSDPKYVELPSDMIDRFTVHEGDLLMARAIASVDHLGKCIVAHPAGQKWAFDSHLMRLRLEESSRTRIYSCVAYDIRWAQAFSQRIAKIYCTVQYQY